jgi:hypothetical protein
MPQQPAECVTVCNLAQHEKTRLFFALQHHKCFIVIASFATKQLHSLKQGFFQQSRSVHWSLARPLQKAVLASSCPEWLQGQI